MANGDGQIVNCVYNVLYISNHTTGITQAMSINYYCPCLINFYCSPITITLH